MAERDLVVVLKHQREALRAIALSACLTLDILHRSAAALLRRAVPLALALSGRRAGQLLDH